METCAISIQSCWSHFKMNWAFNILTSHTVVEGITQVIMGAIKLTYNREQHYQTHQNLCILQKVQQLQTSNGQQAYNHSFHTRSWPGSDLLCEDGIARLEPDGTQRRTGGEVKGKDESGVGNQQPCTLCWKSVTTNNINIRQAG